MWVSKYFCASFLPLSHLIVGNAEVPWQGDVMGRPEARDELLSVQTAQQLW